MNLDEKENLKFSKELVLAFAHGSIDSVGEARLFDSGEIVKVKNLTSEKILDVQRVTLVKVVDTNQYYILGAETK